VYALFAIAGYTEQGDYGHLLSSLTNFLDFYITTDMIHFG
jgi:hypothetical protein